MTTGNETNAGETWAAPIRIWVFSYLLCDSRERVLFRIARRNYYPAAWEFATAREPTHYNLPFRKFLRLSKPRSWTGDPEHVKYRSISFGPLAHAGLRGKYINLIGRIFRYLNNERILHAIHYAVAFYGFLMCPYLNKGVFLVIVVIHVELITFIGYTCATYWNLVCGVRNTLYVR